MQVVLSQFGGDVIVVVDHDTAGGGHCVPGDGRQPAGRGRLGHDAELLRQPLHAGPRKARKVRRARTVLCR